MPHPQLSANGELKHLLTIEGLLRVLIHHILDTAKVFL
jgi:aspartate carbamoyltransferase catalytic subunit